MLTSRWPYLVLAMAIAIAMAAQACAQNEERRNYFDTPFLQVTDAIPSCPTPHEPEISRAQMLAESHYRAERGTSCYQSGRCRLPNAYMYDKEIIPRVKIAILADGRFANTSVWIEGQRRWVWLKGCVQSKAQAASMEAIVRAVDDVEAVVNTLTIEKH
jgi:hypothetical protein